MPRQQYNVHHYLVYKGTFEQGAKVYIGTTVVLNGQTNIMALAVRKDHHQAFPVRWMRDASLDDLELEVAVPHLSQQCALVEEARLAASEFLSSESQLVRGGPWCRMRIYSQDRAEINSVAAATSRSQVKSLAEKMPAGSLLRHLRNESYSKADQPTPAGHGKGPLLLPPKKRSGPSGRSGKSGYYPPGVKRRSGASGSQSSGSARRFNALPLPRKRPARAQ